MYCAPSQRLIALDNKKTNSGLVTRLPTSAQTAIAAKGAFLSARYFLPNLVSGFWSQKNEECALKIPKCGRA